MHLAALAALVVSAVSALARTDGRRLTVELWRRLRTLAFETGGAASAQRGLSAAALARLSRRLTGIALAAGCLGILTVPSTPVRAVAVLALLVTAAEATRRGIASIRGERAGRWLAVAVGAEVGTALGFLSMPPIFAGAFGIALVGSAAAVNDLAVWVALGFCVGQLGAFAAEQRRMLRGRTAGLALWTMFAGAGLMALASSPLGLRVATVLAGAGAGAIAAVLPPELVQQLLRRKLTGSSERALGRMNVALVAALAAAVFSAGLAVHLTAPRLAPVFVGVIAAAGLWALRSFRRQATQAEPDRPLRELVRDWPFVRRVIIVCLNYGALVPADVKAASVLDERGWSPLGIGVALAATILPGAVFADWWSKRIERRGLVAAERLATSLTLLALGVWAAGLWLGGPAAFFALAAAMFGIETWTSFTFFVGQESSVRRGDEVTPVALLNALRFGVARLAFAWLAYALFESKLPGLDVMSPEVRMLLLSAIFAGAGCLLAWSRFGVAPRAGAAG